MESDEFLFFHEKFTWTSKMDTVQIYLIDLVTTFLVARFRHLRMESDFFSQARSWGRKQRKQGQQGQQRIRNPQIEFFESSSSGGVLCVTGASEGATHQGWRSSTTGCRSRCEGTVWSLAVACNGRNEEKLEIS